MKTSIKLFLAVLCLGFFSLSLNAQQGATATVPATPSTQSNEPQRGIKTPDNVEKLISEGKYAEAISEFDKFKTKTNGGDAFDLLYLEFSIYARLAREDNANAEQYRKKSEAIVAEMGKTYSKKADYYMAKSILYDSSQAAVLSSMDKAIKAEPSYALPYSTRGEIYWIMGQRDKACADYKKAMELKDQGSKMMYDQRCTIAKTEEVKTEGTK